MKNAECTVCGAIFEADVLECPICGADKSLIKEIESGNTQAARKYNVTIIGSGISGITVATKIREKNPLADITVITKSSRLPYNRTALTKKLLKVDINNEYLHDETFYKKQGIKIMLDTKVEKINHRLKEVELQNGEVRLYDKLVIATGAVARTMYGGKKNVQTIRHYEDIARLKDFASTIKKIAIIGGGVLGLEIASALNAIGKKVFLIESSPRLMPRFLDAEASEIVMNELGSQGIEMYVGETIAKTYGDDAITTLILSSGVDLSVDYVIESIGIRPNIDLATAIGIQTNNAIVVNEYGETSIPDIYACGDCASYLDMNYGLWGEAITEANAVASKILGENVPIEKRAYPMIFNVKNLSVFSIGEQSTDFETKKVGNSFGKRFIRNGVVVGGILINYDEMIKGLLEEIK